MPQPVSPASRLFALGVVACLSVGFVPQARAQTAAKLGTATFDARRSVVTLPYEGTAPKATLYKLSPTHFYYELQPARLTTGNVQFQAVGGAIERFTLANRPAPDVVRLSFQLTHAAEPVLRVDAAHHKLVVLPLGHEVAHPLASLGAPRGWQLRGPGGAAGLERPFVAADPRRLVLPFKGPAPQFVSTIYQRNPRWIILDLVGADAQLAGERSGAFDDPLFEAWLLGHVAAPHHTRLFLRLRKATQLQASLGPNQQEIWLSTVEPPVVEPLPTPRPVATEAPAAPLASPAASDLPMLLPNPGLTPASAGPLVPEPSPAARPVLVPRSLPLP